MMYNEIKDDMHIRVFRKNKQTGKLQILKKGGKWTDVDTLMFPVGKCYESMKELQDALDECYEFKGTCGIVEERQ